MQQQFDFAISKKAAVTMETMQKRSKCFKNLKVAFTLLKW